MARGGKRPNAGRHKGSIERVTAVKQASKVVLGKTAREAVTAAVILASVDELQEWSSLVSSQDPTVKLKTLMYLTDRRDGKPKQSVDMQGALSISTEERRKRLAELLGGFAAGVGSTVEQ